MKRTQGRRFLIGTLLTAMAAMMPVSAVQAEKTQVTFLNFFNGDILWDPFFKGAFADFEKANPDIEVKNIFVSYSQISNQLLLLSAAGTPPDLVSVPSSVIGSVVAKDMLLPLDSYIAQTPELKSIMSDLIPARIKNYNFYGKQYAFPIDYGAAGMYFDQDKFDQAGLAYPTNSWTMDDMTGDAKKLKNVSEWGMTFSKNLHWMYPFYAAFGGQPYFDRDLKPQFSDPRTIDALRSIQDLIKSQVMPTPSLSKQGHSGMWFDWIGQISTLHQPDSWVSRFDTVALPRTANSAAVVSGQGFAISKGSKHVEAALKVIEWFTSPEMQKRMVEAGVWFPARISVAKFGQPADHRPAHYQQTFIEPIVEYGFSPYWYVPGWSEASAKITPLLNGVWELKDAPAHAALAIDEALKGVKMTPMG